MAFEGRAYLVCASARTGSTLLIETLAATGRVGNPFEYFRPVEMDQPWMRAKLRVGPEVSFSTFAGWRDHIVRAGSERGGVFGASVFYTQIDACLELFRRPEADPATPALPILREFFPRLRIVWLTRRNLVAQAVSHYVAIQTNVWNSRRAADKRPGETQRAVAYDFDSIDWQVHIARTAVEGWRRTLAGGEDIVMPLTYEELAADLPDAVRRVAAHVGVDDLGPEPIRSPGLEKQADEWSRELERLYREEREQRGLGSL